MAIFNSIFLIGGTGFIGRSLLRFLMDEINFGEKFFVTVLSKNPSKFLELYPEFCNNKRLKFEKGDILFPKTLPKQNIKFDYIIHAASSTSNESYLDFLARYEEIVCGTRNLLEYAINFCIKKILFISTGAVYGPQPPYLESIPENWLGSPDLLNPCNVYGIAKRTAEHLCALYTYQRDLDTVIARCFTFVGRDLPLDAHFAIGNFIRDAIYSDSIQVSGDGTPLRTYLDQEDLAHWLLTLLERGRPGEAYNVGSDEVVSIAELAYLVRDLLAPGKSVKILGQSSEAQGRNRYVPDIRKAREELGLTVRIPLAEAIRRTGAAHRARATQ